MWTRNLAQANATTPVLQVPVTATPVASGVNSSAKPFAQLLQQAQSKPSVAMAPAAAAASKPDVRTIGNGETLIGLVRDQAQARGVQLSGSQELRLAQRLASANGIDNPDLVYPGQNIKLTSIYDDLKSLQMTAVRRRDATPSVAVAASSVVRPQANTSTAALRSAPLGYDVRSPQFTSASAAMAKISAPETAAGVAHPVLQQTLDRAVAKGFIPPAEKKAVYDKILQMADTHRFAPDDFARMTLMESDGMNPRASNQRCHGIIQFCDGPARGAASAGYAANPRAILDLSVQKQLSLVDKYFDDVGLKSQGPAGLEDLYLSVLNPASRGESQSNVPLNIQGPQARALHVGSDSTAPITRQSIRQGLLQNAAARLGQMLPPTMRVQAQRAQQYVENTLP
jgi:hypothetical protein